MKRIFLLFMIAACGGGTTTGNDAGNSDSGGGDAVANDSSVPNDSSVADSASDVVQQGDGGLGAGAVCDPQNNQCQSNLLCCSEPTHMADAMTGFFCEQPSNGKCPLLP